MSKGAWFSKQGYKKKTTTITLPYRFWRMAKDQRVNISRIATVALIKSFKQEESWESQFRELLVDNQRMRDDISNMRMKVIELKSAVEDWEGRRK